MKDEPLTPDAGLALENLSLTLGAFALRDVSFVVGAGKIGVILGPNGAGKSVTLETVAGFHRPDSGRVMIGARDVTALPPERRHVAFILQNFGLFPHLTVAENVAFGLKARPRTGTTADVDAVLARFQLEKAKGRRPATLSPGEKQRVALARALITDPEVFLLDEPFAAIDSRTSDVLREELRRFIREAQIPALFVTHDHADALSLADTVAVMAGGAVIQAGPPADVFDRPRTRFVAEFLGVENILSGRIVDRHEGGCTVDLQGRRIAATCRAPPPVGAAVALCLRAESIDVRRADDSHEVRPTGGARLAGTIAAVASGGPLTRLSLDCGVALTAHLLGRTARERGLGPGLDIVADIDPGAVHVIPEP